jgi:hypothetical protein
MEIVTAVLLAVITVSLVFALSALSWYRKRQTLQATQARQSALASLDNVDVSINDVNDRLVVHDANHIDSSSNVPHQRLAGSESGAAAIAGVAAAASNSNPSRVRDNNDDPLLPQRTPYVRAT